MQVSCETALQAACVNGFGGLEIVELLVRWGAAISPLGGGCGTPLQAAAAGGHGSVVGFLLERGADAEVQNSVIISIAGTGSV